MAFFHGFLLAFGLILPLGVQNVFVFNQGASQARLTGWLPVVVTAALCDTLLILLAVAGVSVAVLSIAWLKAALLGAGILFLAYFGWVTWHASDCTAGSGDEEAEWTTRRQVAFAMSVSLLNPHAILDTVGVIGTSSLSYEGEEKIWFTAACILVSWVWFFGLAIAGRAVRRLDCSAAILHLLNRISAVIMWLSMLYLLSSLHG